AHGIPVLSPRAEGDALMNPLDLDGRTFLVLYAVLAGSAVIAAILLRRSLRQPGGEPDAEALQRSPYEVAFLAEGEELAVNAALATLVQRQALAVNAADRKVTVVGELPPDAHPLERAVYVAAVGPDGQPIKDVRTAASPEVAGIRCRLEQLGLLVTDAQLS